MLGTAGSRSINSVDMGRICSTSRRKYTSAGILANQKSVCVGGDGGSGKRGYRSKCSPKMFIF